MTLFKTALRTVKAGDKHLSRSDPIIVGILTIVLPPLLGLVVYMVSGAQIRQFRDTPLLEYPLAWLMFQTLAPVVSLFATFPALLLGGIAMRLGWAGWAVAMFLPALIIVLGMRVYDIFETGYNEFLTTEFTLILAASGMLHGLVMWVAMRWRCPLALASRP